MATSVVGRRYGVMTGRWGWQPFAWVQEGLPTWSWRCAPEGLVTRRQMRAQGLAPGGAAPVAAVVCRRGARRAFLYDPAQLVAKREASPAQWIAIAKAIAARRYCPTGDHYVDYCVPTSLGECIQCHHTHPTEQHVAEQHAEQPPIEQQRDGGERVGRVPQPRAAVGEPAREAERARAALVWLRQHRVVTAERELRGGAGDRVDAASWHDEWSRPPSTGEACQGDYQEMAS